MSDDWDRWEAAASAHELQQDSSVRHDCAQVERDNLDLHQALAQAIGRLAQLSVSGTPHPSWTADLREVLDRTSRAASNEVLQGWAF